MNPTFFLATAMSLTTAAGATLSVRILDEHGAATPARVYLTDAAGAPSFAAGALVYEKTRGVSEAHFVPRSGSFDIDLPAGAWRIVIERGKEYRPITDDINMPSAGRVERTYRLERWVRMNDRGWYSGDMHLHRPLSDIALLMDAEDLNVAIPITSWRRDIQPIAQDPDLQAFLARSDAQGALNPVPNRWFTVLNEELEPSASALLVSRLGKQGSALEYPLATYGRQLHERGALVDSEKATSLELPVIAALGGCDFVGLANNHFWRAGSYWAKAHWGSWPERMPRHYPASCAGFAQAGFEVYSALLNMGLPLKLSAGSANGVHPVPPGWSRVYAHVPGAFSLERWFEAVQSGRTFVTTGPMLLLTVNGLEPGAQSHGLAFPLKVEVAVELLSAQPVKSVEIVVNGTPAPIELTPNGAAYSGRRQITLQTSSWIAARWLSDHGETCDVAHTSPLYFWNGDQPIPVRRADAEYLIRSVDQLIQDVETARTEPGDATAVIVTTTPAQREQTLRQFRQAREFYLQKLAQAK